MYQNLGVATQNCKVFIKIRHYDSVQLTCIAFCTANDLFALKT